MREPSGRGFAIVALSVDQFDAIHTALGPVACREVVRIVETRILRLVCRAEAPSLS